MLPIRRQGQPFQGWLAGRAQPLSRGLHIGGDAVQTLIWGIVQHQLFCLWKIPSQTIPELMEFIDVRGCEQHAGNHTGRKYASSMHGLSMHCSLSMDGHTLSCTYTSTVQRTPWSMVDLAIHVLILFP